MIEPVVLDNESYGEIFEELRSVVNRCYPEWTDFNFHDPGITLLQMFALRKEEQQFFMDQIGDEHLKSYLKLLDIHRKATRPATCMIRLSSPEDMYLTDRLKFYAEDLTFELEGAKQVVKEDIDLCLCEDPEGKVRKWRRQGHLFDTMGGRFLVFGEKPKKGSHMYMRIKRPLPMDKGLSLYLSVSPESKKRVPIVDENGEDYSVFVPFVRLSVSYYAGGEWKSALQQKDDTVGLIRDGFFHFLIEEGMEETSVYGESGYFLRLTYEEGLFDILPCLANISLNVARAVQRDTKIESVWVKGTSKSVVVVSPMAEYSINRLFRVEGERLLPVNAEKKVLFSEENTAIFHIAEEEKEGSQAKEDATYFVINTEWEARKLHSLGVGNGFPEQRIVLEEKGILPRSLSLLVENELYPRSFCLWKWVEDFGKCGPEDRVFSFDEEKNAIVFGDGICGCVPEGEILLASCCVTKGPAGNIKTGRIREVAGVALFGATISNITEGAGGAWAESYRDCFLRVQRMLKRPRTAVSAKDVEERIQKTPGLRLEAVKVLSAEEVRQFARNVSDLNLYTMIRPYGHKPGEPIHPGYRLNILRYMEHYRPVGSMIVLYPPEYVKIELFVDAVVKAEYRHLERLLDKDLRKWFGGYADVFGSEIVYGSLYAWLRNRPYIRLLRSLDLSAKGTGAKQNKEGDIRMAPNGIAVLGEIRHAFSMV
ncbi:MAG: hypothetical protein IJ679_09750 [Lachnospiraceae bacterium]|nr:hypothetical protein [Lachnospiraceae bacterium]